MWNRDKIRWVLMGVEVALWVLTAVYIVSGELSWHFSSGAAGAVAIRALRKKYYGNPPRDAQGSGRSSDE